MPAFRNFVIPKDADRMICLAMIWNIKLPIKIDLAGIDDFSSIYNSQLWLNKNMQIKVNFW